MPRRGRDSDLKAAKVPAPNLVRSHGNFQTTNQGFFNVSSMPEVEAGQTCEKIAIAKTLVDKLRSKRAMSKQSQNKNIMASRMKDSAYQSSQ